MVEGDRFVINDCLHCTFTLQLINQKMKCTSRTVIFKFTGLFYILIEWVEWAPLLCSSWLKVFLLVCCGTSNVLQDNCFVNFTIAGQPTVLNTFLHMHIQKSLTLIIGDLESFQDMFFGQKTRNSLWKLFIKNFFLCSQNCSQKKSWAGAFSP